MHVSFKWQHVLGWWKHIAQLGEGEVGQKRFSGDVTSAGNSWLQDILSPGGLHILPECCSPPLERWIVLLNKIQTFGFLSEVFFLLTCLFSVQHLPSTEHPSGLVSVHFWLPLQYHVQAVCFHFCSSAHYCLCTWSPRVIFDIKTQRSKKCRENWEIQAWLLLSLFFCAIGWPAFKEEWRNPNFSFARFEKQFLSTNYDFSSGNSSFLTTVNWKLTAASSSPVGVCWYHKLTFGPWVFQPSTQNSQ